MVVPPNQRNQEDDSFSDNEIKDIDDLERMEREEMEDEELRRQREDPEFYEDTIEYEQEQSKKLAKMKSDPFNEQQFQDDKSTGSMSDEE